MKYTLKPLYDVMHTTVEDITDKYMKMLQITKTDVSTCITNTLPATSVLSGEEAVPVFS